MYQEPDENRQTKKISLSLYIGSLLTVLVIGIIGTALALDFVGQDSATEEQNSTETTTTAPGSEESTLNDSFQPVQELYDILMTQYLEEIESGVLIEGALEGMADSIGDPYTEFLDEVESSSMDEDIQGSFEGIGAEVMKEGDLVRIVSPIAGSPAEEAGLLPNDYIVEVDGESVADLSISEAVALIRGPQGTEVDLLIRRGESDFTVTLTRDSIPVESVRFELDEDHPSIGYVHITNFNIPTYEEVVDAIEELQEMGAEQFVFDVRGNPGGLLNSAIEISNIFVEDGEPIMQSQGRGEEPFIYRANSDDLGNFKLDSPSVLLIDGGSASASEILAGAMSQSSDIPLIGTTTFGKGTIQNVLPLTSNGEIKFTAGRWLTPNGDWINEEGIQPDIEVEMPEYQSFLIISQEETYQEGDVSEEVENINAILDALGYDVGEVSNAFNEQTREAVESFQADRGLSTDGIVQDATARELIDALRELIDANDTQYEQAVEFLLNN
ncbi:carboxyl-terminal protease [Alkalibacterium sp. AK22]|uniref:S41 family peptidase n=1 Tax=Alkalibacterium sp. AK22 TaxID=1229520 RepID=UPI00044521E9|nr:S41 family peptidase [Alkalibacterium sp. AK22]EXJ22601.1 carboxyl-terminal protease [Alkalibacterium sp. AK22]